MWRWIGSGGFVLIAAAACHHNSYVGDIPPSTERIVIVEQAKDGAVLSTSPLRRYAPADSHALSFRLQGSFERISILGFDHATAALLDPLPGDVDRIALSEAHACDPKLPAPSWSKTLDASLTPVSSTTALPALTAPWLQGRCPDLKARIEVSASCVQARCFPAIDQTGCTLSFDLRECQIGTFTEDVDYLGNACPKSATSGCTFTSSASIHCPMPVCDIELVEDPRLELRTSTITVIPGAQPRTPAMIDAITFLDRDRRTSGYFSDFVVLDDRLAVSTFDNQRFLESWACGFRGKGKIAFFDLETLQPLAPTATATAPPCLLRLAERPGGGFFGVFGAVASWTLGRFTNSGLIAARFPIALDSSRGQQYFVTGLQISQPTNEAIVQFAWTTGPFILGHTLVAIDLATSAQRTLSVDQTISDGLAVAADGRVGFTVKDQPAGGDSTIILDPRTGMSSGSVPIPTTGGTVNEHLRFHEESDSLVVATLGGEPAVFLLVGAKYADNGKRLPITLDYGPYASALHPARDDLELVGAASIEQAEPASILMVYDPHRRAFQHGHIRAGFGPPTVMRHSRGRTWVGLPWEAKILRVEAP